MLQIFGNTRYNIRRKQTMFIAILRRRQTKANSRLNVVSATSDRRSFCAFHYRRRLLYFFRGHVFPVFETQFFLPEFFCLKKINKKFNFYEIKLTIFVLSKIVNLFLKLLGRHIASGVDNNLRSILVPHFYDIVVVVARNVAVVC